MANNILKIFLNQLKYIIFMQEEFKIPDFLLRQPKF